MLGSAEDAQLLVLIKWGSFYLLKYTCQLGRQAQTTDLQIGWVSDGPYRHVDVLADYHRVHQPDEQDEHQHLRIMHNAIHSPKLL